MTFTWTRGPESVLCMPLPKKGGLETCLEPGGQQHSGLSFRSHEDGVAAAIRSKLNCDEMSVKSNYYEVH